LSGFDLMDFFRIRQTWMNFETCGKSSADRDVAVLGATLVMTILCSLEKCHPFGYISQISEKQKC
jgi:hypothetical protein